MQNKETDQSSSRNSSEPQHPLQPGEQHPDAATPSTPEADPLAATQIHFTAPNNSDSEPFGNQVDPLAETRAVNIEPSGAPASAETRASSPASGGQQQDARGAQITDTDPLAATLPLKFSAAEASTPTENDPEESPTRFSAEDHLQATQVTSPDSGGGGQPPQGRPPQATGKKPHPLRWVILIGILGLIGVALLSAFAGYTSGIRARKAAAATQAGLVAQEQYDLALQEIASKDYVRARQRLEYVIQIAPDYPGAAEKLAEVIFMASITATPTLVPSPTLSPTPDMRGAEERLEAAKQQIFNSQWAEAIDTLLLLRKAEPNFQPAVVDDLLYLAYRNSGRDKILKDANLEGGIYDLTLAEKFGPLDTETKGLQNWARLYLLGASYWDVDWGQVVYYFAQVAPAVPNLRDGSGWTATERYRIALGKYAEQLLARKEWCSAMEMYQQALSYGGEPSLQEGYNRAYEKCVGSQVTPTEEGAPPAEAPTETPQP